MAERGKRRRRGGSSGGREPASERARGSRSKGASVERADGGRFVAELCELTPFSLFCALHLGITDRDGFALQKPEQVARRFSLSLSELDDYVDEHGLDLASLEAAGFDRESARLDMRVAPEGISRTELARTLFEDLRKPE